MAHPADLTMSDLTLINSSAIVLRVNEETTVLGQVSEVTIRGNVPNEKVARIGDTSKVTIYKPAEFSVDVKLFADSGYLELAQVINGANPGTWDGNTNIELTPTSTAFDIFLDIYTSATGSVIDDTITATITVVNFKPASMELPISGDANAIWTINGQCDRWYVTPAATA
jgi:hypothetical protein